MDKQPPDKDKKENRAGDYNPALTEEAYEKSRRAWKDSPQGRAAIRIFSRGLMGAAFFTAGGLLNRRWMHSSMGENAGELGGKYDATKGFAEQKNPLQFIAKTIDTFVGKPIEFIVKTLTGNEELAKRAVRFRPTKFKDMEASIYEAAKSLQRERIDIILKVGKVSENPITRKAAADAIRQARAIPLPKVYRGRSLGNETVAVTFDFFCASVGDALGRDIVDWFDPHVEKKWIKNGHIDISTAAKQAVKSTWQYVTYNGGEDWAVGIPYVYFMKGQRAVINHFSPGFMYDFDRNLHGGSHKINKEGHIIGNYNIEGALDLQSRFTVYNMGTLAFREAYDYAARKIQGKHAVLYGAPDRDNSHETLGQKISNGLKWMVRSVIKGGIYMTPATPFFWISRTPQTNHRGLFIHVNEHGQAMTLNYENTFARDKRENWLKARKAWIRSESDISPGSEVYPKYENLHANEIMHGEEKNKKTGLTKDSRLYFSRFNPHPHSDPGDQFEWVGKKWYTDRNMNPLAQPKELRVYDHAANAAQKGFNVAGRANYRLAHSLDGVAGKMDGIAEKNSVFAKIKELVFSLKPAKKDARGNVIKEAEPFNRFTHPFVYASTSYTPYMYAKAEAARLWDTGKMDLAAERMIDGAAHLKWGEFRAGAGEVWRSILHKPFKDPEREKEAERRVELDTSQSAGINRQADNNGKRKSALGWRERLVTGEKPEVGANEPKSYAEREEMREALKDMHPPTNSVN